MKRLFAVLPMILLFLVTGAISAFAHELSGKEEFGARMMGALSFINIVWVFGIGLAAIGFFVLLKEWIVELIQLLPAEVYEVVCYLISIGFIVDAFAGTITSQEQAHFVALTGCVFFGGSVLFTHWVHELHLEPTKFFGAMLPVFAVTAIMFNSPMIGFGAIVSLMALVGFSVWIGSLCYGFGFDDEQAVERAGATSLFTCLPLRSSENCRAHSSCRSWYF